MNRAETFLDIYRELESIAIDRYHFQKDGKSIFYLALQPEFRNIKSELDYCREVRNLLSHNPKVNNAYTVEPSEEMIDLLKQTIEKVKNPQRAKTIMIPKGKILWKTMDDYVLPVVQEMVSKIFTNVPILDDGVAIGVFSESTILSYLVDEEIICIDHNMIFESLKKQLLLHNHTAESFAFVGENTLKVTIEDMFAKANQKGERLGLVFVTHSGKETEKVLGIITVWDLINLER